MKNFYEIKNIYTSDFEGKGMIADVDMKSRTVTGYFSRFGNKDSDDDIMEKGSFVKTISERGSKGLIPHILDHDIHVTLKQLSKPTLYEKADGGFFESTISDTTNGIDTLKLYRDGVINQHSFGFKILQKEEKTGVRHIKEVLLYEISTVTLGANSDTPFTGFKSMNPVELKNRYEVLTKAFKDGDYTDETFAILDAQIKQIEGDMALKYLQSIDAGTTQPANAVEPEVKKGIADELYLLTLKHF